MAAWPFRKKQPPPPRPNVVTVDEELAAALTGEGTPLETAVNGALRSYLDAKAKEALEAEARGIPFWLRRESERTRDLEEELRHRVIHRRSSEEGSS